MIPEPEPSIMRHPQDDLLIVFALTELARKHKKTPTESHAIELSVEIAGQHGLTPAEAIRQLEERSWDHC